MKKTIRSLQKGRSMLEVIAILAVMGILLIAGMVGFKVLLDYLKHKETIEQITTISMRHKASRLNAKTQTKGYIPMDQVYPEGNNCVNGANTECVTTPEGNEVRLFNIGENKSFMVLVSSLKSTTCEELAIMGGYEFVFTPANRPNNNETSVLDEISEIIQGDSSKATNSFTFSNNGIFGAEGKTIALTPEYIKKNPTVLKTFCDPNLPLLGFVYTPDEDCNYFYDGACHDCPRGLVQDDAGTCCLDSQIDCGMCFGCGATKKCLEAEQRCVECIENSHCPAGKFCSNNKCVTCETPFYNLNADGECTCVGPEQLPAPHTGEIGSECKEACNCKAGLMCIEGKCAECLIQPDCPGNVPCVEGQCKCDDDEHPCPPGQVCCHETCCPAGQFCNAAGVCSNCETNDQCGVNRECCEGVCCAEGATCCNGQCCNKNCITVDGQKICGGCDSDDDCPDNEYCDTTEHVCKPCLNEALRICGDSVTENFNTKCYTKKHLNCLDSTGTKDNNALKNMLEDDDIQDEERNPICTDRDNSSDTTDTCGPCTSTEQCNTLTGNGDSAGDRSVLSSEYVCRLGHEGADDKFNGTCGPCIDTGDCGGIPCLASGKCGCEANADCDTNCNGKTTCDAIDTKDCTCTGPLLTKDATGNCVCPINSDKIWRLKNNNDGNAQYACCPARQIPSNGECYPECTADKAKITKVKIFVDHSYSTIVGSTKIAENIEKTRKLIRRLIKNVGREIRVSESNEYTENGALTVTRTIDGESITFTAYNCGDNGHTCFANPNTDNGAIPAQEDTLTFILSDGLLPFATTQNLKSDYTVVFAKDGTSLHGIDDELIIPFDKLSSDQLEERISGVTSTSVCMSIDDILSQLHACSIPSDE